MRTDESMAGTRAAGVQNAGYVEPHVVEPDAFTREDPVDAQALGGGRTENSQGFLGGHGVQVAAFSDAGTHGAAARGWPPR